MRLIDATPLECQAKDGMGNEWNHRTAPTSWAHAEERFLNWIEDAPTVDAVIVTRCEDCKYYRNHPNGLCYLHTEPKETERGYSGDAVCVEPDDFCSYGERKNGDANHDA